MTFGWLDGNAYLTSASSFSRIFAHDSSLSGRMFSYEHCWVRLCSSWLEENSKLSIYTFSRDDLSERKHGLVAIWCDDGHHFTS